MKKLSSYLVLFACAFLFSLSSAGTANAAIVTKNKASWVLEQQDLKADAEAREEEAAAELALQAGGTENAPEGAAAETAEEEQSTIRSSVVNYALSFLGNRYVYGGEDPHSGVDCSGFTRYILGNAAGVYVSRTSRDQSTEGRTVTAEEMQPGDLLFYTHGRGGVDHVAMYIGNGQIVHASTEKTGIKISRWDYRTPVRIAIFLG